MPLSNPNRGCATREVWWPTMEGFWFPAPEENIEVTSTPWVSQAQSMGGFHFQSESSYKPRRWTLQWNNLNEDQVHRLQNWLQHGDRLYKRRVMFANPFAFRNMLSPFLSDPYLFVDSMSPLAWSSSATTTAAINGLQFGVGQIAAYSYTADNPTVSWRQHTPSSTPIIYDEFVPLPPYMLLKYSNISSLSPAGIFSLRGSSTSLDPTFRNFSQGANPDTGGIRLSSSSPAGNRGFVRFVIQVPSGGGSFSGVAAALHDNRRIVEKTVEASRPGLGWGNVAVDPQSVSIMNINAALKRYSARFEVFELWPW